MQRPDSLAPCDASRNKDFTATQPWIQRRASENPRAVVISECCVGLGAVVEEVSRPLICTWYKIILDESRMLAIVDHELYFVCVGNALNNEMTKAKRCHTAYARRLGNYGRSLSIQDSILQLVGCPVGQVNSHS